MEEPINVSPDTTELKQQVADLRRQTSMLYLGVALLSLTLAGFIGLQKRHNSFDLDAFRPQANQLLDIHKKETPAIQAFVGQLEAYGKGHPEYAQKVLAKYGVNPNAPAPTGVAQPPATLPK